MKRSKIVCVALITMAGLPLPVLSQMREGMEMKGMEKKDVPMTRAEAKAQTHKATGTVKAMDRDKGTLVLAHGPIQSMNWPAMTMTFKAKDKALLEKVKPGANVEFTFVHSGKDFVVTDIR